MTITILSGSVRKERNSFRLALYLETELAARGIAVSVIDLAATPLPIFGLVGGDNRHVDAIADTLAKSDGFIFVTPEYHGSFSGALKNALDFFWSEFQRKPVAVAAASAGRMGGINASTQLQHVILSLGAYALPSKLLVPEIHIAFDDSNNIKNERTRQSAVKFLDELMWFAEAVKARTLQPDTA